ncbi:MAG: response regulator [Formivibrio sp.]|nr:response regulator [Formivibrio sp.]
MRVLVVDDDAFAAEMIVAVLEEASHDAVIVESGVAAVDRLAVDTTFEAVVSDMNMPFVNGLDLFAALRAEGCNLPFILLSGDDPASLLQREPRLDACIAKDGDLQHSLVSALVNVFSTRN